MPIRDHNICFAIGERLWRRLEARDVKDCKVRPNRLRLQLSVSRSQYTTLDTVPHQKWNGVAEAKADAVAQIQAGSAKVACVDDPCDENIAHALIAMVADPGSIVTAADISGARQAIANAMVIVREPTQT
jgi:hypothetical protein